MRRTGRTKDEVALVERYMKEQQLSALTMVLNPFHQGVVVDMGTLSRAWPAPSGRRLVPLKR